MIQRTLPSPLRRSFRVASFSLGMILGLSGPALAAAKAPGPAVEQAAVGQPIDGTPGPGETGKSVEKSFDEIVKGAERHDGLFTLYKVKRELFAEIRPDQLDTEFLFLVTRGSGLGERWIYFGDPGKEGLVVFRHVDDQVQLIQCNTGFRASPGSALERSVRRSFADSLLASFNVEATHPERKTLLINLTPYLLSDVAGTALALNQPGQPGGFSLDTAKSYWGKIQSFPQNLELDAVGVLTSAQRNSLANVPDSRGFLLMTHYSLAKLPPSDYRPRLPDPRVGWNTYDFRDFSNLESGTPFRRYLTRWNLQKRDPAATLSPPRKPIRFYLENNIPPEYRPAVREGLLLWNQAFERIGIQDAIEVREQPDDAEWDANDFRYNTVRWVSSSDAGFAAGGYRFHPITGEALKANILVQANWVLARSTAYEELADPLGSASVPQPARDDRSDRCALGLRAPAQLAFGATALELQDAPLAEKKKYLLQSIRWMAAHEMGHVLGMPHNFHASTMLPLRDLHNTAITRERGLAGSVMDYLPPNLAPLGTPQGDYFTQALGPYDYWAIEYAYTPIDAATPEEELPQLRRIASRAAAPELAYGPEADSTSDPTGVDPLIAVWDLSSDPIGWADQRMRLCRDLLRRLEERVPRIGEDYTEMRRKFARLLGSYLETLDPVAGYVGGISTSRGLRGDPGAGLPLKPVPAAQQRRALRVIERCLFDAVSFQFSPSILSKLARDPSDPRGSVPEQSGRGTAYYPLREQVLGAQKAMLARLTQPALLSRLANTEMLMASPGDALTLVQLFGWLTHASWSEVSPLGVQKPISAMRRSLQREYVATMIGLMLQPAPGTPEDARTLAWAELTALRERLLAAQRHPAADPYTRAHLAESAARIARALEARMSMSVR
jgi:Met-zincin/Domain of unknown function (DUF5117)